MNDDPRLQNLMIRKRFFNAVEGGNKDLAQRIFMVNSDLFTDEEAKMAGFIVTDER